MLKGSFPWVTNMPTILSALPAAKNSKRSEVTKQAGNKVFVQICSRARSVLIQPISLCILYCTMWRLLTISFPHLYYFYSRRDTWAFCVIKPSKIIHLKLGTVTVRTMLKAKNHLQYYKLFISFIQKIGLIYRAALPVFSTCPRVRTLNVIATACPYHGSKMHTLHKRSNWWFPLAEIQMSFNCRKRKYIKGVLVGAGMIWKIQLSDFAQFPLPKGMSSYLSNNH